MASAHNAATIIKDADRVKVRVDNLVCAAFKDVLPMDVMGKLYHEFYTTQAGQHILERRRKVVTKHKIIQYLFFNFPSSQSILLFFIPSALYNDSSEQSMDKDEADLKSSYPPREQFLPSKIGGITLAVTTFSRDKQRQHAWWEVPTHCKISLTHLRQIPSVLFSPTSLWLYCIEGLLVTMIMMILNHNNDTQKKKNNIVK